MAELEPPGRFDTRVEGLLLLSSSEPLIKQNSKKTKQMSVKKTDKKYGNNEKAGRFY